MRLLSQEAVDRAASWILGHARPLERSLYRWRFEDARAGAVLDDLARFQNPDGGFGRALEPDLRLADSSAMATSVALRILAALDDGTGSADRLIEQAIAYLEASYAPDRGGWLAVPPEVNDHPHAPWWRWDAGLGITIIDRHWGNPNAEIAGYLLRYRRLVRTIDVDGLLRRAVDHINSLGGFESEHEIFCYIRLYSMVPEAVAREMEPSLTQAVTSLVSTDPGQWRDYVPHPLKFVPGPGCNRFGIAEQLISDNLDFLINEMEACGRALPSWSWEPPSAWETACREWTGVLTCESLMVLDQFGRIDR